MDDMNDMDDTNDMNDINEYIKKWWWPKDEQMNTKRNKHIV